MTRSAFQNENLIAEADPVRYATFSGPGGARTAGIVDGETLRPLTGISLEAFIARDAAGRAEALAALGAPQPLAGLQLLAPLLPNKNVFCVGRNYLAHAEEGARALGKPLELPPVPTFFTKAPTAIAGPDQLLHLSAAVSPSYDWEAELALVIGRRCKDVAEADALDVVFGYTALNDVSARDLQRLHQQWFKGKSLDDTAPLGPWIVDAAEVGDPQNLRIALRVNGETKQDASTAAMIFDCRKIIAQLSRGMTLEPGDIIATGTPEGVGFARTPPEFLKDGDVMEVDIEKIGVLRNPVRIAASHG
jgi:2-keto-4-pentenoate hydratase/2-oxohepta-3-ene-1,7-dioic acid hydratase in catechol pathway